MSRSMSDIKGRLAGIKQTRQITNAMYLLSAADLKKELSRVQAREEYNEKLRSIMAQLLGAPEAKKLKSEFTVSGRQGAPLYLIITGNKGLSGSYNADITDFAAKTLNEGAPGSIILVFGNTGASELKKAGIEPEKFIKPLSSAPGLEDALNLTRELTSDFLSGKVSEIYILCTPYTQSGRRPECVKLLPLDVSDFPKAVMGEKTAFEPDIKQVFERLSGAYCEGMIYSALVKSSLSENAARMDAMRAATDNADEMSQALEAELNALRQLNITNEITEIAAAAGLLDS